MTKKLGFVFLFVLCFIFIYVLFTGQNTIATNIQKITLKAYNGNYICAEGGGGSILIANRSIPATWETLELIHIGDDFVALKTNSGHYVAAEGGGGGEVTAIRSVNGFGIGAWETFELIRLEGNMVAFMTKNGSYLTADGFQENLIVADRNVLGQWEKFEMVIVGSGNTSVNTNPTNDTQPSGYSVESFGQIGRNVLARVTSTNNYVWVGEYSQKRGGGYEHLDDRSRLWYTTDGQTWREGGHIDGYESINAITATRNRDGVNFGSEQGPKIFTAYESNPGSLIHQFTPDDGRYTFVLGIDDAESFGELATFNAPNANPQTRLAGFFDGAWRWAPYPAIDRDFIGWDLLQWNDWLLVGGSGSWPAWPAGSGQIVGTKQGWNHWELVAAPGGDGKGCMTLTKVGNTLIASFASQIWWTTDPDLNSWNQVDVPGYWNHNLVQTGPETVIGLWFSGDRWPAPEGNGVWLVEFNFVTGATRTIHKWEADGSGNLPYYVGGDLSKLGENKAIGFYSSGGKSYGVRVTW